MVILKPLTDEIHDRYHELHPDECRCFVCTLPCWDADVDGTRESNCVECLPCFLCEDCSYMCEDRRPRCLSCLAPQDAQGYMRQSPGMALRLKLVADDTVYTEEEIQSIEVA